MNKQIAIIIGAGPAGLTAAYEFLDKTNINPIIIEMTDDIGGISKTINYKGNRIDIGGHRFFSKSEKIMQWWQRILPLQGSPSKDDVQLKRHVPVSKEKNAPDPEKTDQVMLIRKRLSRIFFKRKLFDYPIAVNFNTFSKLGLIQVIKIIISYFKIRIFSIKNEASLEDFLINRFGKELYLIFFKDYTEKIWGVSCNRIKPEWGAQRIKGLSISRVILDAFKRVFVKDSSLDQKNSETSLIKQFMYPKYGPGQLWEEVAEIIKAKGGELYRKKRVIGITHQGNKIISINLKDEDTGDVISMKGDYYFSSMPIKDLIESFADTVPQEVRTTARGLIYRDFITVGLLLKKLKIANQTKIKTINNIIPDNWIYIQERDVRLGRIQIFNNWSPYMVQNQDNIWIGLEYFCDEGDNLWSQSDHQLTDFAVGELIKMDMLEEKDVLDSVVIRMPKTYPAYFGTYDQFHVIRDFTDQFENLFLIGRNGMHRYNNQDHSMLAAMTAVDNIVNNIKSKDNIWDVNTGEEYHESK